MLLHQSKHRHLNQLTATNRFLARLASAKPLTCVTTGSSKPVDNAVYDMD
jgi:hypothetical protein